MTLRLWKFELANGTTMIRTTCVSEGTATAASAFGINSGTATFTADNTYAHSGTALKVAVTAFPSSTTVRLPFVAPSKLGAVKWYEWFTAPPATTVIANIRHSTTDGVLFAIAVATTGIIEVLGEAGYRNVSAQAITFNQLNRFEVNYEIVGTGTGQVVVSVFAGNSTTAYVTHTITTGNFGTADATHLELGTPNTVQGLWTVWIDEAGLNEGSRTPIGPSAAPAVPLAAPVVTVTNTSPSVSGATDGTATATWPPVAGAVGYETDILSGNVTTGAVADDANATSPKVYTGLGAGTYTISVRAKAS